MRLEILILHCRRIRSWVFFLRSCFKCHKVKNKSRSISTRCFYVEVLKSNWQFDLTFCRILLLWDLFFSISFSAIVISFEFLSSFKVSFNLKNLRWNFCEKFFLCDRLKTDFWVLFERFFRSFLSDILQNWALHKESNNRYTKTSSFYEYLRLFELVRRSTTDDEIFLFSHQILIWCEENSNLVAKAIKIFAMHCTDLELKYLCFHVIFSDVN